MKKISVMLFVSLFALARGRAQNAIVQAQDTGIHFERASGWAQILARAKAENKFIFVDCYTTWCGPCKYMSKYIFPMEKVGDFMNAHFINVEIQMDRTNKDAEEVKQWYGDADTMARRYAITAYPTYLFFSPDGVAVHRASAAARDPKAFLAKAKEALDPEKQYYTYIGHYKEHKGDSAFLLHALRIAENASDRESAAVIAGDYLESLKDPYEKKTMLVLLETIHSTSDTVFRFLLRQPARIDAVMGHDWAEGTIRNVIIREEMSPYFNPGAPPIDWKKLSKKLRKAYPAEADRVIAQNKVDYYLFKKDWPAFEEALLSFMKQYGDQLSSYDLNMAAWNAFLYCNNPKVLREAVKWSRSSVDHIEKIDGRPEPNYLYYVDTYANLLYKTGDKDNAIAWEKKALAVAEDVRKSDKVKLLKDTIAKMENGTKTWN